MLQGDNFSNNTEANCWKIWEKINQKAKSMHDLSFNQK